MLARQLLRAASLRHTSLALSSTQTQAVPSPPAQSALEAAVRDKNTNPGSMPVTPVLITEAPERDLVNFPRPSIKLTPDPCRFLFIPESWFELFYNKTGVTGPYCLGGGYILYLFSKEIWVIDHELPYVICLFAAISGAYYKFGDVIGNYFRGEVAKEEKKLQDWRAFNIKCHDDGIKLFEKEIWRADAQKEINAAKKENVLMQLEAEYRSRAQNVYNQVKRRLDYQLQIQNIDRRIAHKHMVNWIIDNVRKSITPQQEKDSLKKCFADLQALAAKA